MLSQRVIGTKLPIGSRVLTGVSCGTRNRNVGLRVNSVGCRFAPLARDREHQFEGSQGMDRQGRFDMDEVYKACVAGEGYVVTVGEKRIEGVEFIVMRIFVARSCVDLQAKAR